MRCFIDSMAQVWDCLWLWIIIVVVNALKLLYLLRFLLLHWNIIFVAMLNYFLRKFRGFLFLIHCAAPPVKNYDNSSLPKCAFIYSYLSPTDHTMIVNLGLDESVPVVLYEMEVRYGNRGEIQEDSF